MGHGKKTTATQADLKASAGPMLQCSEIVHRGDPVRAGDLPGIFVGLEMGRGTLPGHAWIAWSPPDYEPMCRVFDAR